MNIKLQCLSHTPLRNLYDPAPAIVEEINAVLAKARTSIEAFDPELIVLFFPDHYNGFFYDMMPAYCIGTAADSVGDFSSPPGSLNVPKEVALDCARFLMNTGIDVAVSYRMMVDHGCTQPLVELTGSLDRYPVLPVFINSVAPPFTPYWRVRQFGEAVGRFIAQLNKRVLIVGSGGLSHEPPVPLVANAPDDVKEFLIAGRNPTPEARAARQARTLAAARIYGQPECQLRPLNPDWDLAFIDTMIHNRLAEVDLWTIDEITEQAGKSVHEVRTWVAAFAALAANGPFEAKKDYYRAIPEWIAGYGVASGRSC